MSAALVCAVAAAGDAVPLQGAAPVRTFAGAAAAPGRLLVQFKPSAAATARLQARIPLRGLQLERLVGKHQGLAVGRAAAAAAGGRRQLAAATGDVPPDATLLFSITDGKSVQEKIKELRGNAGDAGSGCVWGAHRAWARRVRLSFSAGGVHKPQLQPLQKRRGRQA